MKKPNFKLNSPCIKGKCIKYPVCKNKDQIECTPFHEHMCKYDTLPTFYQVNKIFPQAIAVSKEKAEYENGVCLGKVGFIKLKYDHQ